MSNFRSALWVIAFAAASLQFPSGQAHEPLRPGVVWPSGDLAERIRTVTMTRGGGFLNLTRTVVANRSAVRSGTISLAEADSRGGTAISGRREIPVLLLKFADTGSDPYASENLQRELFGSWPTGT